MTENSAQILVFKTSVSTDQDKFRVGEVIARLPQIEDWSIDMEDVDRVLRVVSHEVGLEEIIARLKAIGIECCELNW